MMRRLFLTVGAALISASAALAIPQTLNFQGFLKESGSPVNAARDMTLKIYSVSSGGVALFTDSDHTAANGHAVIVSTGIFNVAIGEFTPIPLGIFDGNDRYVEATVGSTTLPRQKITSTGYAVFAATAATLAQNASIQISSAVLTATGSNQFSLQTSSGINVQNGGVTAPFFSGTFVGNGSGLTGLTGIDSSKVAKAGDTMTGQLTVSGASVTVTGAGGVGVTYGVNATTGTFTLAGDRTTPALSIGTAVGPARAMDIFGGNEWALESLSNGDLQFVDVNNPVVIPLYLKNNTNVGIHNMNPATALHMSSGTLTIDGNVQPQISVGGGGNAGLIRGIGNLYLDTDAGTQNGVRLRPGTVETINAHYNSGYFASVGYNYLPEATTFDVNGSAQFGSGAMKSTFTATPGGSTYALNLSSGINVQNGGVTAPFFSGTFVGNGSGLTGLTGTDSSKVAKAGDTMTGQLTVSGASVTVTGTGGLGVTYGVTAGSATLGGATPLVFPLTIGGDIALNFSGNNFTRYYNGSGGFRGVVGYNGSTGRIIMTQDGGAVNGFSVDASNNGLLLGGNLGIGNAVPDEKLSVSGAMRAESNAISFNGASGLLLDWLGSANQARFVATRSGGVGQSSMTFLTYNGSAYVDAMDILPSGNVGIGIAAPATDLDVTDGKAAGSSFGIRTTAGTNSADYSASFNSQAGAVLMRVRGDGNVGIGIASPFDSLTLGVTKFLGWEYTTGQAASRRWEARTDLSVYGDWALRTESVQAGGIDTTRLYVGATGNVGIGTTNPATMLDVNGSAQFGSGATKSTFTTTGALNLAPNAAINLTGASGNITTQSSMTASAFYGDGSHLTGMSSSFIVAFASAAATAPNQTISASAGLVGITGSTLTIHVDAGHRVLVSATVGVNQLSANHGCYVVISYSGGRITCSSSILNAYPVSYTLTCANVPTATFAISGDQTLSLLMGSTDGIGDCMVYMFPPFTVTAIEY